ncbi:Hpt domain-containing protein [Thiococcus pfennigii]|uniref:Hpt domain-containing protein n=1 Tax=Thiococcus pfennigii TaxID=1057 RepID=UPI001905AF94
MLAGLVGDDPEIIQELLRECLTGTRHGFEALHAAVTTADPAAIGATAHRLKSSLRAAGARSLGDLCAALERSAKTKTPDWEGITRLMAEADATWHEVERAISAELAGTGGQDAEDER